MACPPRRKNDDNITVETLCHHPSKQLYGLMLDDYNTSKCLMKEKKFPGSQFYICSCTGEECNDELIFPPCESIGLSQPIAASVNQTR